KDHKLLDHRVKAEAIVEPLRRERAEFLAGLWRVLVEQLERDRAFGRLHGGGRHVQAPSATARSYAAPPRLACVARYRSTRRRLSARPRSRRPSSASITRPASSAGTDRNEKRSRTSTSRTASPS